MTQVKKQYDQLVLAPMEVLEKVLQTQEQILEAVSNLPEAKPQLKGLVGNKYIPESEAQKMLGRKTTWFFNMRKAGKLKFRKMGNKTYYEIEDIEKLIGGDFDGSGGE